MKISRILVPIDFSDLSRAALNYAATIARATGAELLIVHVREMGTIYDWGGGFYYGAAEPEPGTMRKALEAVFPDDPEVRFRHRLLDGEAASTIIAAAAAEQAELIVMATHGRTGLGHLLMGSVAEAVVRGASCPVLTLRPSQLKAEARPDARDIAVPVSGRKAGNP